MVTRYEFVENWEETDLLVLPKQETAEYEYKSSRIQDDDLRSAIAKAASAFWNSGGGYLILGIDDKGQIDGGITNTVGKQTRPDWIDRALSKVSPQGHYKIKVISSESGNSLISANCSVFVIAFEESINAPHMAHDNKYYIKAGAHSDPAPHFLVEAIRAKKHVRVPMIRAILRNSSRKNGVVELAVVVVNDAAALNVNITFEPLPKWFEDIKPSFPLQIPLIDQQHEFSTELFRMLLKSQIFGDKPILLKLDFDDVLGNKHHYEQLVDPERNRIPLAIGDDNLANVEKAIKELHQSFRQVMGEFYDKLFPPKS